MQNSKFFQNWSLRHILFKKIWYMPKLLKPVFLQFSHYYYNIILKNYYCMFCQDFFYFCGIGSWLFNDLSDPINSYTYANSTSIQLSDNNHTFLPLSPLSFHPTFTRGKIIEQISLLRSVKSSILPIPKIFGFSSLRLSLFLSHQPIIDQCSSCSVPRMVSFFIPSLFAAVSTRRLDARISCYFLSCKKNVTDNGRSCLCVGADKVHLLSHPTNTSLCGVPLIIATDMERGPSVDVSSSKSRTILIGEERFQKGASSIRRWMMICVIY